MALPVPTSLSPSKVASFTGCALQFRFSAVERLPDRPTVAAMRGTVVHAALEILFGMEPERRTPEAGPSCVDAAIERLRLDDEWIALALDDTAVGTLRKEAVRLVERYFRLEDPRRIRPVGVELQLEVELGGLRLRGIIDRLDLVDGELVVTDYKTGRAPSEAWARRRMTGVHFYSLLCERHFGRRPARVQLLHLAEPVSIVAEPSEQSTRGLERRLGAIWDAVESACEREDFRPRRGESCSWCSYQQWCPAFGGDPSRARVDLDITAAADAGQLPLVEA